MDHFAKPDDELTVAMQERSLYRNFQGYSTHSQAEVYAMGITSISQLNNAYAQNTKTTKEYEQLLDDGKLLSVLGYKLSQGMIKFAGILLPNSCATIASLKMMLKADFKSILINIFLTFRYKSRRITS